MKIISVVPSITELLFDLGLENQIIGRTKFCIHPNPEVKEIQQFGGTKKLHVQKIIQAHPDLILANKEENLKNEIQELQEHCCVHVSDLATLEENNRMILEIGEMTKTYDQAQEIVNQINTAFDKLSKPNKKPRVLYLIWKDPMMSIGQDTFIHNMLEKAGFTNLCAERTRYPVIENTDGLTPDFIFLSSEPYPFAEKHIPEIQQKFPDAKIVLVDGEMFSWYGSRMRFAPEYFLSLREKKGLD